MVPSVEPGLVRCCSSMVIVFADVTGRTAGRNLSQPEIQNLGVFALGDKNVCWLDVAMNDALGVRRVQPVGNLNGKREHGFVVQRLSRDEMLQRHAIQKLHGDERLLAMFADFVDGANVGMIESRRRTRLPSKPFQRLRISRQFIGQEFESDESAKLGVFSFIDHAHAATAELLDDAVV